MCAYTFSRDWYERMDCPFCNKGEIQVHHVLPIKTGASGSVSSGHKFSGGYTAEKEEVQNDCTSCGAKKEEIQKRLKEGSLSKPPSRQEILKRLKDAGLPTKV